MRFYYENNLGDRGIFQCNDLILAIYSAWNLEASLYIESLNDFSKMIFSPWETNEFNSELLEEYGYYMVDGDHKRIIKEIETNKIVGYEWEDVIDLF